MSKTNNQVNLNIDELKGFLTHTVKNNNFLQAQGKVPLAVCVEGPAGIGKTSSIEQLATELKLNFVKLNLSELEEISDLVGFPLRQFQLCKNIPAQVSKKQVMEGGKLVMKEVSVEGSGEIVSCLWIDEQAVDSYIRQGYTFTGQKRMSYCAPEWIVDKGENGYLLLDDYSRADHRFIQATMTLIDRQSYISWSLPKGWTVILSTNPDDGNYQVNSLDVAQSTRFATVNLKFDIECWSRFAEKVGVDTRCINFLLLHPELVTEKCNARSITNFFNSISSFEKFEDNLPMIQLLGEGSVGPEFSTMFTLFINNKLDKLVSPKEILTNPNWVYIKGQLNSCIGVESNYRADIASILSTRIINYSLVHAEKHAISKDITDRLIAITTQDVLANDLRYFIIKGILNGNKAKFAPIMLNPEVVKMAVK